jgi:hypothetical protein
MRSAATCCGTPQLAAIPATSLDPTALGENGLQPPKSSNSTPPTAADEVFPPRTSLSIDPPGQSLFGTGLWPIMPTKVHNALTPARRRPPPWTDLKRRFVRDTDGLLLSGPSYQGCRRAAAIYNSRKTSTASDTRATRFRRPVPAEIYAYAASALPMYPRRRTNGARRWRWWWQQRARVGGSASPLEK